MLSDIHAIPHILQQKKGCFEFVDNKELHFKRWPVACGILTDCFGSYCILLVFVNYSVTGLMAPALGNSVSEKMAAMKIVAKHRMY